MTPDRDGFDTINNFDPEQVREMLGLDGKPRLARYPEEETAREVNMLLRVNAITSEEISSLGLKKHRLGNCPVHGQILFIEIYGAFVCPGDHGTSDLGRSQIGGDSYGDSTNRKGRRG